MILSLLLLLMSASANANCSDILLKFQNQFYHVKTGRFVWLRSLHEALRNEPLQPRWVRLQDLKPIHPIDYPIPRVLEKLERRRTVMDMFRDEILTTGLSLEAQEDLLPSSTHIRIIDDEKNYFVKDGNGRLMSLKVAFGNENPLIEVEQYKTTSKAVRYLVHRARVAGELE